MNGKYVMLGFSWMPGEQPLHCNIGVLGFHTGEMDDALAIANSRKEDSKSEHVGVFDLLRSECFSDMTKWFVSKNMAEFHARSCVADLAKQLLDVIKPKQQEHDEP